MCCRFAQIAILTAACLLAHVPHVQAQDSGCPTRSASASDEETTQPQDNRPDNQSKSYLSRLFSPENLPNIGLLVAGIVGICVAIGTLKHMQESSERQLRAYVVMEVGSIVNIADPINPPPGLEPTPARRIFQNGPVAHAQIKNTGQTPAFNVEHWGNMCFREFPLQSELPGRDEGLRMSRSILGPGIMNTKTFGIGPILTDAQVAELRASTAALYVYGEILYEDAFKRKHFTRYRLTHNESSGVVGVSTELTFADKGNEAD